jgi:hypothetical protein
MGTFRQVVNAWECCSLLSPIIALCVNVVVQVGLVRVRKGKGFLRSVIEGLLGGFLALTAFDLVLNFWGSVSLESIVISGLVNAPIYLALSYCYFGVANLGHTSIRIRLYSEIAQRSNGMSLQEIEEIYNEKTFAEMRLQRSLESGDIIQRGSRHYLGKARLAVAAHIIGAIRGFLVGAKSEFE